MSITLSPLSVAMNEPGKNIDSVTMFCSMRSEGGFIRIVDIEDQTVCIDIKDNDFLAHYCPSSWPFITNSKFIIHCSCDWTLTTLYVKKIFELKVSVSQTHNYTVIWPLKEDIYSR